MKVLELKGFKSLKALNAFHALLLGVKMLPSYVHEGYEEFLERVQSLPSEDQERIIREAALFVELQRDEVEALVCFCTDNNGVPYGPANLNNLGPKELIEIIVAVCMEISKIKIDLLTPAEKKN
jgi:hypothetical protein